MVYVLLLLPVCILHHESDTCCHWSQFSPFKEASPKKGWWATWSSQVFQAITEVSCWSCEGGEIIQLFPFLICKMLQRCSEMEGSFSQPLDRNKFDPKQIAPTLAMKEPPPTEVLMKGPAIMVYKKVVVILLVKNTLNTWCLWWLLQREK